MKTALFTNFTDREFTGYWDGKAKRFAPGQSLYMPDYLAKHFAKHLVNRELLRTDGNGNLIYKDGERMTSPKKPEEVPIFMELFNQAYKPDEDDEFGAEKTDIDTLINVANKNRQERAGNMPAKSAPAKMEIPDVQKNERASLTSSNEISGGNEKQDPSKPQIIVPPDFNEEDDDESAFQGKPVDTTPAQA